MGVIISRFRRKKTSTEVLESLETNIKAIEQDGALKEQRHKRVIGYVMAYSVGLYVLFALMYYYMYVGKSNSYWHSIMYASPLLLLPVLVIFLRAAISWYFNWSLTKNRVKLNRMRDEKRKILEEVMNTETYKVAKQILEKYGSPDDQSKTLKPFVPTANVPGKPNSPLPATPGQIRQRQLAIQNTSTPINKSIVPFMASPGAKPRLTSDQLPRPLLDENRTALDKVVDYLLKDGPNYRMALVCSNCNSHNGMSLMEEFEFVSYVCAYCGRHNPARRQRPKAPPLMLPMNNTWNNSGKHASDDSSVASSNSDSDDDKRKSVSFDAVDAVKDQTPSAVETPKSPQEKKED